MIAQGREVLPHIIRINLIIAEMYGNDDPVCENCASLNLTEYSTTEPEYKDAPVLYWDINALGSLPAQPEWRERRDKIEKKIFCNFCSHAVSLGIEWSDWYKVQCLEVQQSSVTDPWVQRDPSPAWNASNGASYVVKDIWAGDSSYPRRENHMSTDRGWTNSTGIINYE